uniref:Uncharacterized protein n=1 Tax=uncultured bacterium esnapd21 TaxID=1366603 RepID=S5TV74_9BACT|nr:hypothetical protein [uncultured bacterium esnapd21]
MRPRRSFLGVNAEPDNGHVVPAVPDDALSALAVSRRWRAGRAVVRCNGATESATLAPTARQSAQIGGFLPLQSISDPDVAVKMLS